MAWGEFKDIHAERRLFQRRIVIAMVVVLVLFGVLAGRLYFLQVYQHDTFTTLSEKNRVQVRPVSPPRGLIHDRNGVLLAENRPVFRVTLVPERVDDMEGTLERLQEVLSVTDDDLQRFRDRLREYRRPFSPVPLLYDLSKDEMARMAVNRHKFPGVEVEAELVRYYPHSRMTAHALGYVGRINKEEMQSVDPVDYAGTNYIGKSGVEQFYEDLLHGSVGYEHVETNARGRTLRVLEEQPPEPGRDLTLSLDIRLQEKAFELLGDNRGAVVALDPDTGGILALASKPGFDTNQFVTGIGVQDYRTLSQSPDKPLFNRALRGQYPPGSTIKPMLAVAALDSNATTREKTIWDPGYFKLKESGRRYRDWKRSGHGWTDLNSAIAESCDVYFYHMGVEMGVDTMHDYLARFGLGGNTALDIPGARAGLLPSAAWKRGARGEPWYPGDNVNMSIGQGFMLATPLQLVTATTVMANRGEWRAPHMLKGVQGEVSASSALPESPLQDIQLTESRDWQYVVQAMEDVVHGDHGTARSVGRGASYRFAGKTGTAQVFSLDEDQEYEEDEIRERLRDHALFVGFAPVDDPEIAVAVLVENGGSGSATAAPIARSLFDAWLMELPRGDGDKAVVADSEAPNDG